jgi:murein DD-endopeptidase MepM/ murein hydrolase activator NlpD
MSIALISGAMADALTAGAGLLAPKWLMACIGCVAAGLLAWLLLNGAARIWPALRTRRAVWLAAQSVVLAVALLPFLPHIQPSAPAAPLLATTPWQATAADSATAAKSHSMLAADAANTAEGYSAPAANADATNTAEGHNAPAANADAANTAEGHNAHATNADAANTAAAHSGVTVAVSAAPQTQTPATPATPVSHVLSLLAALWLPVYAIGLAWAIARQLRARRLWRGLLASAHRLSADELQAHNAFTDDQRRHITQRGLTLMRTDAAISPMLIGVLHPILLLPAHLDALTREQQQMIIAHELHHWRARDPLCLTLASYLQTLFWFNPTLRWMSRQMEWALELSCDQHVLAKRPQHQRKQYAASLLQQWSAMTPAGVAAFGGATITARIRHMQQDSLPPLSATAAWLIATAFLAIIATGAVMQPALAYSIPAPAAPTQTPPATTTETPAPPAEAPAPATPEAWRMPLDKIRVTSFFGTLRSVLPTPHRGIDFGAAKGTPVHASSSGTVIAAGAIAENNGRYGNTVIIEHGAQHVLYAHLNSVAVKPGQHIRAGQLIGAVGETGFATGPHLHLEIRQNGHLIDPATMLAGLDQHATPHALKMRRQQLAAKE